MQTYQFRCEDCGVLFEGIVRNPDSPISCEFCQSSHVKKLFMVSVPEERDDESLLEGEC
ncbi:MAG: hypothetical protein IT392_10150 [Nitrospirae bacterium]|nr:hypothetical protein [Nitrospirota bacterium]